jgi:hypothetical protein
VTDSRNNSGVRVPPAPSDAWLSQQKPEDTRSIRDPQKSKTLPMFQAPSKQRRRRRAA